MVVFNSKKGINKTNLLKYGCLKSMDAFMKETGYKKKGKKGK